MSGTSVLERTAQFGSASHLVCRECGTQYEIGPSHVCEMCFGPLEVKYDYEEIRKTVSRKKIQEGPHSMWRYVDLLPVEGTNFVGTHAGSAAPQNVSTCVLAEALRSALPSRSGAGSQVMRPRQG